MGSGKSTVGRLVAERLGRSFYDTDELVEQAGGASIAEIFAAEGESGFRERERRMVGEVASRPASVVATGGGIVLDPTNVEMMRISGVIVLLDVDFETASDRIGDNDDDRPLLADGKAERLRMIASERGERYRSAAEVIVDATGPVDLVVASVEAACSES